MTTDNDVAQAEPARRGRPRAKPKVRSGELLAKMQSAAILLLRAQRSENAEVVKELIGAALDTLKRDVEG